MPAISVINFFFLSFYQIQNVYWFYSWLIILKTHHILILIFDGFFFLHPRITTCAPILTLKGLNYPYLLYHAAVLTGSFSSLLHLHYTLVFLLHSSKENPIPCALKSLFRKSCLGISASESTTHILWKIYFEIIRKSRLMKGRMIIL